MKLAFLKLPPEERRLYIEQAAGRRNVSPVVLEKDFWVCWLLGILFESEFAGSLVFKGGTSLSKVFGVIERFSEDIDLSLSPTFLNLPDAGTSRNQANKWMTRAEAVCGAAVRDGIAPVLSAAVEAVLGKSERAWFEFLTDSHTNSPVLLFHYPSSQPAGFAYLSPRTAEKLALPPHDPPAKLVQVDGFAGGWVVRQRRRVGVVAGKTVRSRLPGRPVVLRVEDRRLLPEAPLDFERHDLAPPVGERRGQYFSHPRPDRVAADRLLVGEGTELQLHRAANYDRASPGTFRLVPPPERLPSLRRDYQAMRDMYLSEPASFDDILSTLADLEARINGAAT